MPIGLGLRRVRQVEAAEIDRQRMRIVQLDEVRLEKDLLAGQPLVDSDRARIAERMREIGLAERRGRQMPQAVRRRRDRRTDRAVARRTRRNRSARPALSYRYTPSPSASRPNPRWYPEAAVSLSAIQDQVTRPGFIVAPAGKTNLRRLLRIVAEAHAGQADRRGTVVVQLDEIREDPVVLDSRLVDRQHLVDDEPAGRTVSTSRCAMPWACLSLCQTPAESLPTTYTV